MREHSLNLFSDYYSLKFPTFRGLRMR